MVCGVLCCCLGVSGRPKDRVRRAEGGVVLMIGTGVRYLPAWPPLGEFALSSGLFFCSTKVRSMLHVRAGFVPPT